MSDLDEDVLGARKFRRRATELEPDDIVASVGREFAFDVGVLGDLIGEQGAEAREGVREESDL